MSISESNAKASLAAAVRLREEVRETADPSETIPSLDRKESQIVTVGAEFQEYLRRYEGTSQPADADLLVTGGPADIYALNTITPETEKDFDAANYSLYKYGDATATLKYAHQLVIALERLFPKGQRGSLTFTSSAFMALPTAAVTLTRAMTIIWNARRAKSRESPARLVDIKRGQATYGDFSEMTPEQRAAVMEAHGVELPSNDDLKDRHLVIIDDSRITGAHEIRLRKTLETAAVRPLSAVFFYIVAVPPPLAVSADPDVVKFVKHAEGNMNSRVINGLEAMSAALSKPGVVVNQRIVKVALLKGAQDPKAMEDFLRTIPLHVAAAITQGAVEDGFTQDEQYLSSYKQAVNHVQVLQVNVPADQNHKVIDDDDIMPELDFRPSFRNMLRESIEQLPEPAATPRPNRPVGHRGVQILTHTKSQAQLI